MAVGSTTASDDGSVGRTPSGAHVPIRTCIGCRIRLAAAELLRVVVVPGPSVVPDPRHRAPGRGAWLHRDVGCVDLAERRRAFGRALKVSGPVDPAAVREYVISLGVPAQYEDPTSGIPQE